MSTQAVKAEIINNVMVAMSYYIQQQTILSMLEQVMQQELVRVNMEEITTLPAERQDSIAERDCCVQDARMWMTQVEESTNR